MHANYPDAVYFFASLGFIFASAFLTFLVITRR